jgi:hypothetical protein
MRLTIRSLVPAAACLAVCAFLAGGVAAQADTQVGVWKLIPEKSKYSPGPGPKSGTSKIEAAGKGTKVTVSQIFPDGATRHWEFTADYDGKDSPVTGNNPDADTVARTRVDANTVKMVSKKGGKVTLTQTSSVSADGKTRTVTSTGTNASGKPVNNVAVYERQ